MPSVTSVSVAGQTLLDHPTLFVGPMPNDAQVSKVTLWVETFREAARGWWMDCRSDWYQTLKRDFAMPLNREKRRSAVPGFLATLVGIETLLEEKGGRNRTIGRLLPCSCGTCPG